MLVFTMTLPDGAVLSTHTTCCNGGHYRRASRLETSHLREMLCYGKGFLFSKLSTLALGPSLLSNEWALASFPGVKVAGA
jgi:hypothetical protein